MKTIKNFKFKGKRALVRCDFNVPLDAKRGKVGDDFRIRQTVPTIEYLIGKGAKIILISHLGRPGKDKKLRARQKYSLRPVASKLEELLGKPVRFLSDCIGERIEKEVREMRAGEIKLLENLRFHKEEEENNVGFSQQLSKLGDIYINDAFGCCHRSHASIIGIPQFLPSGAGLLLKKEIDTLSGALKKSASPLVVIIGGVKIATKIKLIERFLKKANHLLLGGKIAYEILTGKGMCPGGPLPEAEILKKIEKINLTSPKLHLPIDAVFCLKNFEEGYSREAPLGQTRKEEELPDIGPETIKIFSEIIKIAKTVIWSGPLGYIEDERFAKGSLEIANAIIKSKVFSIIGGGDTVAFLAKYNLREEFDHVSTGGGAMLQFLSGEELPGLQVLEECQLK